MIVKVPGPELVVLITSLSEPTFMGVGTLIMPILQVGKLSLGNLSYTKSSVWRERREGGRKNGRKDASGIDNHRCGALFIYFCPETLRSH